MLEAGWRSFVPVLRDLLEKSSWLSWHRLGDKARGTDGRTFAHTWSQIHVDTQAQLSPRHPNTLLSCLRGTCPILDSGSFGNRPVLVLGGPLLDDQRCEVQIPGVPQGDPQVEGRHIPAGSLNGFSGWLCLGWKVWRQRPIGNTREDSGRSSRVGG